MSARFGTLGVKRSIIFFILFSFVIFEFSLWILYKKFPLFYDSSVNAEAPFDESTHSLYSTIDPNLGYTFSVDFKPSRTDAKLGYFQKIEEFERTNGFVIYKKLTNEKPVVFAVVGNCSSDAHLFDGNWPYQFHLLLVKAGISHVIYNGSVSGYNSFQQLVKLARDVFNLPSKIDYVIATGGMADIVGNGDVMADQVNLHPYQLYISQYFTGQVSGFKPKLLPNIQNYLFTYFKKLGLKNAKTISLGPQNRSASENYVRNVKMMNAIVEANQAQFFHVRQSYMTDPKQADSKSQYETINYQGYEQDIRDFTYRVDQGLKNSKLSLNFDHVFKNETEVFGELSNLSIKGQKIFAQEIFRIIFKNSRDAFSN